MARDGNYHSRSLVFPILLIVVGGLFLYAHLRPAFDPYPILTTYWPLILVFVGLGKIWDYSQRRKDPSQTGGSRSSVGATIGIFAFVVVLIVLLWHGRAFSRHHNFGVSTMHIAKTVDRQNAQTVNASVEMGAGELTIAGGSDHLLDASFDYHESEPAPQVEYAVSGNAGDLKISEGAGEHTHFWGSGHNNTTWNLRFGNEAPLDLNVNIGAGQGNFRLRDVPLAKLELHLGAGRAEVDLTGNRTKDLDANIQGGVGEAIIRLPKNVGVIANASGGIGTIDAHGLKHNGGEYTNEAYGHTPATIHLNITGGIGRISLSQEP